MESAPGKTLASRLLSFNGLFAVQKPKGPTSAAVLNLLREKLLAEAGMPKPSRRKRSQMLKIGHGGILDSTAAGVLVVGVGKGTKMLSGMLAGSKATSLEDGGNAMDALCQSFDTSPYTPRFLKYYGKGFGPYISKFLWDAVCLALQKYTAVGELGKATDTYDSSGKVTEEKPYDQITKDDLENVLQKFTGNIMQIPPLYSALKKDGQRLSTLVKKGEFVEAKPARPVVVYNLTLRNFKPPLFTLDVECGGGFYVRSLVNDIGRELSSCATVRELTRTKQGPFTLEEHALSEDKWTIDEIGQSLERCMLLLQAEPSRKKLKTELSEEHTLSCEDK